MAGDLGSGGGQVHEQADAVLRFWFGEVPAEKRFARDAAIDAECARRFGELRDTLVATRAEGWRDDRLPALAAVIVLDQFSRNVHRGSAEAFAADPLAREIAAQAIEAGWDRDMSVEQRQFLYMPFMHSEELVDQDRSVALFAALGDDEPLKFAYLHRDVIVRFGRFPGRNAALGRESNAAEREFLEEEQAF